jgi:acetylglutamate kinase
VLNLRVVKLGGNELDRPDWVEASARALKRVEPVVVVHGGGKAVDALSRRLGLPVEKREGLRVTTAEVAEVVEMTLTGAVSRHLVSALRRAGLDALGLAGVDGGLFRARVAPGGLGFVGEIVEVRTALLESLLLAGFTPVIAPVTPAADGDAARVPLNVNADHAAAAVAGALGASELLFVSNVPGVEVDGVAQPAIALAEIDALIARGVATSGMAAKLRAAAQALKSGARAVRIGDLRMLDDPTAGTRLLSSASHQPA